MVIRRGLQVLTFVFVQIGSAFHATSSIERAGPGRSAVYTADPGHARDHQLEFPARFSFQPLATETEVQLETYQFELVGFSARSIQVDRVGFAYVAHLAEEAAGVQRCVRGLRGGTTRPSIVLASGWSCCVGRSRGPSERTHGPPSTAYTPPDEEF